VGSVEKTLGANRASVARGYRRRSRVKQDGQGTMGNDILRQMRPLELWNLCDAPNLSGSHVDRRPLVVLLSALETQLVTLGYDRLRLNTVIRDAYMD